MKSRILATLAASLLPWIGVGCSGPKTEVTACSIEGELIPDGTLNAQNQCQVCRAKTSPIAWANIAAGTACGDSPGSFCAGGSCQAGCYIDSIFFPSAAADPSNGCLGCQPSINATGWSPITGVPPAGACPQNGICFQGHCAPGCTIGATQVPAGTPNPDNFCQSCQPAQGASTWTDKPPGATCADGGAVCAKGNCTAGCEIGGVFYSPGGSSPDNVCQTCQPKESITAFSPTTGLAPGGTCGNGSYCFKGQCSGGCAIGGTSYAPGDTDPANACLGCDPTVSAITWSSVDPGTPCAGSGVCSGGTCLFGCQIGGLLYPPDTNDPAQVCKSCQPAVSPTSWSPLTGIPTDGCVGGQVCLDGGCAAGCFIKKTYYAAGARKPDDVTQCCSTLTTQPGAWSPAFAPGTSVVPTFAGIPNYSVTYQQVLAPDLNRDNLSDVVLLSSSYGALVVLINQGDGGFSEAFAATNVSGSSIAAGDVTGDSYPDLVLAATDSVYLFANQGDGGFGDASSFPANFVHYDAGTNDGGFASYYYSSSYYYALGSSILTTDVNRDGILDVVTAGGLYSNTASVLLGGTSGALKDGVAVDTGLVSTFALGAGDFNGDGWPDLIALGDTMSTAYDYTYYGYTYFYSFGPGVTILLNDGTGAYGPPIVLPAIAGAGTPSSFALGDFDGDGKTDIAVSSYYNQQFAVLIGVGDGTFQDPVYYALTPYYYYLYGLMVGDFNGDGAPDLMANGYYSPTLFLNDGHGTFSPGAALYAPYYTYSSAAARFFGTGPDDLAVVDSSVAFTPYFNNCR